jgi:hypothetical protein
MVVAKLRIRQIKLSDTARTGRPHYEKSTVKTSNSFGKICPIESKIRRNSTINIKS